VLFSLWSECHARKKIAPTVGGEDVGIELFARGGKAVVKPLDIWEMKAIW